MVLRGEMLRKRVAVAMTMEKKKEKEKEMLFLFLSCILVMTPINAATDQGDASALNMMFQGLKSPSQLTTWTISGGDPCGESWKGVKCSGSRVTEIHVSGLGLTGSLWFQVTSLTALNVLDVSNNNLGNQIPYQLPPNLLRLNLAGNGFNGNLPYSINSMTTLQYLDVSHNQLQGQLGEIFGKLTALTTLDLSFNQLSGNLPESFSSLSSIASMYLQNNQFTGSINVLAGLPLDNLNIANNQFSGWVPQSLQNINLQKDGNQFNSGPAPPPPPGTPPANTNTRHKSGSGSSSSGSSGSKSGIGGGGVAGIVISLLFVGAVVAFFLVKRRKSRRRPSADEEKLDDQPFTSLAANDMQELKSIQTSSIADTKAYEVPPSISLKPPPIVDRHKSFDEEEFSRKPIVVAKKINRAPINVLSYSIADLQMATESFSHDNLIGEGTFGRVYRAQFDDGKVVAVKKIDSSALTTSDDFLDVVSNISPLHHANVTELVGYCSEHGQYLLVHEFHKNGSLHDFLHLSDEYNKPLTWNTRVKIALGSARALEYLHEVCSPSVIHKNFKSANILLDGELNPHVTDCGLASFIPNADQFLNQYAGSGYGAPEIAMSGQYTIMSDVYSFGVVMLELLTGRKPFDSTRPRSEQSLVRWATPQLHDIDALGKMVDPALKGLYPVKSLSRFADVIALCVQSEPEFRPPMSEVVQAMVRLVQRANMSKRTTGIEQGGSQQADNPDTP